MIKKLFVSLCMILSALCFIAGGKNINNYTTYAEESAETYELNFNGEAGKYDNVATTGMKKNADLTGGKSLVALMDIKSAKLDTSTNLGVFFRITDDSLITRNWPPTFIDAFSRLNMKGNWKCSGKDVGQIGLHDLFKNGNTIKIEYKPFVDDLNKGSFNVWTKNTGTDDTIFKNVISVVDIPQDKAPSKAAFYISVYGDMTLEVQNYSIKVSDGTVLDNSFVYSYKGIEDAGKYQFDTSMNIKRITEDKNTYHMVFKPQSSYFGSEEGANIPLGEALVMEYDVLDSNFVKDNYNVGFIITTVNHFNDTWVSTNNNTFTICGNPMLNKAEYPSYCVGASGKSGNDKETIMEGEFLPYKIFAGGNRVKAMYRPYVDESNKGSFEIYTSSILNSNYTLAFKISNICKEYAPCNDVRIHMLIQNSVSWLKDKEFILHMNNYRIYTTDNAMDKTKDIKGFGSHNDCIIQEVEKPITVKTSPTALESETKWIKPGSIIKLNADPVLEEGKIFDGWYFLNTKTNEESFVSEKSEFNYTIVDEGRLFVKYKIKKIRVLVEGILVNGQENFVDIDWNTSAYIFINEVPKNKNILGIDITKTNDNTDLDDLKVEKVSEDRYKIDNIKEDISVKALYEDRKFNVILTNASIDGKTDLNQIINSEIVVVANSPLDGYKFSKWIINNEVVEGEDTITIIVDKDLIINAIYEKIKLSVKVNNGSYSSNSDDTYYGDTIFLSIEEKDGYKFKGWCKNGELISNDENYSFTLTEDVEITAEYTKNKKSGCNSSLSANSIKIIASLIGLACIVKFILFKKENE